MDVGIGLPNTIPGTDGRLLVEWARIYAEKWDIPEARRLLKEALKKNPPRKDAQPAFPKRAKQ